MADRGRRAGQVWGSGHVRWTCSTRPEHTADGVADGSVRRGPTDQNKKECAGRESPHHRLSVVLSCVARTYAGDAMTVSVTRSQEWQHSAELQARWPCFQVRSQADAVLIITGNAGGTANEA